MIWSLVWYPFALALRRPRGVFAPLAIGLGLAIASDLGFAAAGVDTFSSAAGAIWESGSLASALWVFFVGFVMGVALTDLGERPNDRATFDDALGILALNAVYGVVVGVLIYLPLEFVLDLAVSAARSATAALDSVDIAVAMEIAAETISLIVWAYVSARLSFSGPLTLIRGKIVIFSAWPDTRGRVLKIVVANVAGFLMLGAISALGSVPGQVFSQAHPPPVQSLAAAVAPRALVEMFAKEITIMIAIVYYAATQAYVFHRLKPKESSSEEAAPIAA
jgi:hypothetical protein